MVTRRGVFLLWMSVVILACNMPMGLSYGSLGRPKAARTIVESVKVRPQRSNGGEFTITVDYYAKDSKAEGLLPIECTFSVDGSLSAGTVIGEIIPTKGDEFLLQSSSLTFTVTEPERYFAICYSESTMGATSEGTIFIVNEPTPTPTNTPENTKTPKPTPTVTPTLPRQLKAGKILFNYAAAQSQRAGSGGELDAVTKWCVPDVTIGSDGSIKGVCEYSGNTQLIKANIRVEVEGVLSKTGAVQFTYDVTEKGSNGWTVQDNPVDVTVTSTEAVWHIQYTGEGAQTGAGQASGEADFTYSCDSGATNLYWCASKISESFSGKIPWRFEVVQ